MKIYHIPFPVCFFWSFVVCKAIAKCNSSRSLYLSHRMIRIRNENIRKSADDECVCSVFMRFFFLRALVWSMRMRPFTLQANEEKMIYVKKKNYQNNGKIERCIPRRCRTLSLMLLVRFNRTYTLSRSQTESKRHVNHVRHLPVEFIFDA